VQSFRRLPVRVDSGHEIRLHSVHRPEFGTRAKPPSGSLAPVAQHRRSSLGLPSSPGRNDQRRR
jgi:hypothetical protein